MSKHCCRCWLCVDEHEINICAECTLEELNSKVASKGLAFSFIEEKFKDGEIPH
jgi:hypothetical protein